MWIDEKALGYSMVPEGGSFGPCPAPEKLCVVGRVTQLLWASAK